MSVDYLSAVIFCFADMLDKNHLAGTVCTILSWHIVSVAGMWILHLVYVINFIDSTRMEAQWRSFSNACKSKDCIKSCSTLFKMAQLLVFSVCFLHVLPYTLGQTIRCDESPVSSFNYVPIYKSIIYVTTWLAKSTHQKVIFQQNIKNTAS